MTVTTNPLGLARGRCWASGLLPLCIRCQLSVLASVDAKITQTRCKKREGRHACPQRPAPAAPGKAETQRGGSRPGGSRADGISSRPSGRAGLAPAAQECPSRGFPGLRAVRSWLHPFSFAFSAFKVDLWFVCFYTRQIRRPWVRHCTHADAPGV